jgi:hypothetical protein
MELGSQPSRGVFIRVILLSKRVMVNVIIDHSIGILIFSLTQPSLSVGLHGVLGPIGLSATTRLQAFVPAHGRYLCTLSSLFGSNTYPPMAASPLLVGLDHNRSVLRYLIESRA